MYQTIETSMNHDNSARSLRACCFGWSILHMDQEPGFRHCEERSDAAVHAGTKSWIATAFGLAMTRWGCGLATTRSGAFAMTRSGAFAMTSNCHCEERSDAAVHAGTKSWIATAFGLAMTRWGCGLATTRWGCGVAMTRWGLATTRSGAFAMTRWVS